MLRDLAKRIAGAVEHGVFRGEDPFALGVARVAIAGTLTASLFCHVGAVDEYFSDRAPLHGEYARIAFPSRLSWFFFVGEPTAVRALFGLGVVAHLFWVVGLFTKVAGLFSFATWVSLVGRNPLLYSLPDQLQMALAMLLAAMPAGRGFSVDAIRRRRPASVPVWCRRMIQLQLGVLYTGTGLLKTGDTWRDGTALYYAMVNPYNRHFEIAELLAWLQPWFLRPLTFTVLVWEVAFFGFVVWNFVRELGPRVRWLPDLRLGFLGFGVLMHASIQLALYVVWFSPLSVASYLVFWNSEELRRGVGCLVGRVRARLGARTAA